MNTRDKLLSAALATFFIIISATCSQSVTYSAGKAPTAPYSTQSPDLTQSPVSPIESAAKPFQPSIQISNDFDANNLNCGFVTSSQGTWESTEINYQCWTIEPDTCFEDMDCWQCESMGNKICSREHWLTKLFGDGSGYEIEIDYQVRYEMEGN